MTEEDFLTNADLAEVRTPYGPAASPAASPKRTRSIRKGLLKKVGKGKKAPAASEGASPVTAPPAVKPLQAESSAAPEEELGFSRFAASSRGTKHDERPAGVTGEPAQPAVTAVPVESESEDEPGDLSFNRFATSSRKKPAPAKQVAPEPVSTSEGGEIPHMAARSRRALPCAMATSNRAPLSLA